SIDGPSAALAVDGQTLSIPVDGLKTGDTALLSLRPERIEIRAPGAEGIDATVTEAEFMGSTVLYRMKTATDRTLMVQALADRAP
ncbi:TOBE domain-containing protein, partial [Bacillus sp. NTK071]